MRWSAQLSMETWKNCVLQLAFCQRQVLSFNTRTWLWWDIFLEKSKRRRRENRGCERDWAREKGEMIGWKRDGRAHSPLVEQNSRLYCTCFNKMSDSDETVCDNTEEDDCIPDSDTQDSPSIISNVVLQPEWVEMVFFRYCYGTVVRCHANSELDIILICHCFFHWYGGRVVFVLATFSSVSYKHTELHFIHTLNFVQAHWIAHCKNKVNQYGLRILF